MASWRYSEGGQALKCLSLKEARCSLVRLRGLCGPAQALCTCFDGVRLEFVDSLRPFRSPSWNLRNVSGSAMVRPYLPIVSGSATTHWDCHIILTRAFVLRASTDRGKNGGVYDPAGVYCFLVSVFFGGCLAFCGFLWCVQESYAFSRLGDHFRPPCRDFCESLRLCNDPYREF